MSVAAESVSASPVWAAVARAMADGGARRCFGVVGGANFKVTHGLTTHGIPFVAARHEGGAVTMADAAARLSGDLTVVSVTAGPGLTNAVTGIGEAAKSDTPLVVLAGDVALGDDSSSFSIRQADLVRSVGARWLRIDDPGTAYDAALAAAALAVAERCVVVVSLPVDVQEAQAATGGPRATPRPALKVPDDGSVAALTDLVLAASRPLLLAGRGARAAGAEPVLIELADATGALLATTLAAHGTFAGRPWNLGISGGYASPAATDLIPQADLVVAFGASLNGWTTDRGRLLSGARVVQVDDRAERFGRFAPVDLTVLGDAAEVASRLLDALRGRGIAARPGWRTEAVAAVIRGGGHGSVLYTDADDGRFIDPRTFTKAVDDRLPAGRVVVVDGGHFTGWPIHHLSVPDADGWCMPIGFQSIGLGLATAVGAAVARPDRLVVLAAGDGGFLMSLADLETAARLGGNICALIYNDSAYGAEVHHFKDRFALDSVRFPEVDFARIARAFGGDGIVVRSAADLAPLEAWVSTGARGLFLVDARIDPDLGADWFMKVIGAGKL